MRRLLVRRLVAGAGLPADALGAEPVARVLALLDGGGAVALPGDGRAALEGGLLVVVGRRPAGPGARAARGARARALRRRRGERARGRAAPRRAPTGSPCCCDGPLTVRPPRDGDRLAIRGGGRVAVGRLLAGAGVPPRLRPHVPVVATADRVVWVAGHRAAADLVTTRARTRADPRTGACMSEFGTVGETLIAEEALQARIAELAAQVSADYAGREPLVIGVLKGAVFFIADLAAAPHRPVRARLHGRLLVRLLDPLVGRRADPEGPRHPDRRPPRAAWWRTSSTPA